jgi:hypothetical protein
MSALGHVQKIEQRCDYGPSASGSGKPCRFNDLRQLIPRIAPVPGQAAGTVEVGQLRTRAPEQNAGRGSACASTPKRPAGFSCAV